MADILGVIASASQLIQYALRISATLSEAHKRLHDAPELQRHAAQIEQLIETTRLINQDHQYFSNEILGHLRTAIVEAEKLVKILELVVSDYTRGSFSQRYYKSVRRGSEKQKKIATSFAILEREKTSLIVCISLANTKKLSCIQTDVTGLLGGMAPKEEEIEDTVRLSPLIACVEHGTNCSLSVDYIPRERASL